MPNDDDILVKLDAIISSKIESALKPLLDKIDALTPPPADGDEETEDKLDALPLAEKILRDKLDGFIPADKLKAMSMLQLSQTLAKLQSSFQTPQQGGILNPIEQKAKTDALFTDKTGEIIWEE